MLRPLCILLWLICTGPGLAQCRQALALGLDVSGSVDSREYRLQLDGLAAALQDDGVRAALLSVPQAPVHLAVFEWSGATYHRLLIDWTALSDSNAVSQVARQLRQTQRSAAPSDTALGAAMQFGADLLARQSECWKRTLDISGDGKHNAVPHPRDVRAVISNTGLTVNALVIGADSLVSGDLRQAQIGELSAYFRAWVITGPDAFVETALGFDAYEAAMIRKLKRELQGVILSALPAR